MNHLDQFVSSDIDIRHRYDLQASFTSELQRFTQKQHLAY